jgi:hypothetical protein
LHGRHLPIAQLRSLDGLAQAALRSLRAAWAPVRLSHSCTGAPGLGHGLSAARWPASAAACSAAPGTVIYLQCVPVVDAGTAPRMALPASATRSGTFHSPRRRWLQQRSDCAGRSHCEVLLQIICTNRSSSVTEVNPHF